MICLKNLKTRNLKKIIKYKTIKSISKYYKTLEVFLNEKENEKNNNSKKKITKGI